MGAHITCYLTQADTPRLIPSCEGRYSIYLPRRMEGWVDLADLITPRLGVEPTTAMLEVHQDSIGNGNYGNISPHHMHKRT